MAPWFISSMICGMGIWLLRKPLLDLFGIVCAKDAFVTSHLELSGGSTQWNANFARVAHDWEVDAFASFYRVLYLARVRRECENKLW
jgi:hypothetical protein